jgi:hypothetical protein
VVHEGQMLFTKRADIEDRNVVGARYALALL